MKLDDILNIDYRKPEGKETIQKALRLIKPFAKCTKDNVPLESIEKYIGLVCRKYTIMIQYITPTYLPNNKDNIYSCSFKTTDSHEWLGNVYGHCLYELMAKAAIKMHSDVKRGKVNEHSSEDWSYNKRGGTDEEA